MRLSGTVTDIWRLKDNGGTTFILGGHAIWGSGDFLSNAMHCIRQTITWAFVRACVRPSVQILRHHISITVQDRRMVTINHPWEVARCESNGHVTDDVTRPPKIKVMTTFMLNCLIFTTGQNTSLFKIWAYTDFTVGYRDALYRLRFVWTATSRSLITACGTLRLILGWRSFFFSIWLETWTTTYSQRYSTIRITFCTNFYLRKLIALTISDHGVILSHYLSRLIAEIT